MMRLAAVAMALFCTAGPALASGEGASTSYPSKPIRVVVGYPPGGSGDFLTRVIADELAQRLRIAVVVDNRPGAGGTIAADLVAKAAPDGYTVLNAGHQAINQALYRTLSYDPDRDLVPITLVARGPTILCVQNDLPVHSVRELVDYARARPGAVFNAGSGFGSAPHLASVAFEAATGVRFTSVQFKGGGPAAQSLLAGDTQVMFATPPTVMGFIHAKRMRALAVTARQRSPSIPGIPGMEEAGLPGYESTFWFGLYVPAGTPRHAVDRLFGAATEALRQPEVQHKIAVQGMDASASASPAAFAELIRAEGPGWAEIVRASGARVD